MPHTFTRHDMICNMLTLLLKNYCRYSLAYSTSQNEVRLLLLLNKYDPSWFWKYEVFIFVTSDLTNTTDIQLLLILHTTTCTAYQQSCTIANEGPCSLAVLCTTTRAIGHALCMHHVCMAAQLVGAATATTVGGEEPAAHPSRVGLAPIPLCDWRASIGHDTAQDAADPAPRCGRNQRQRCPQQRG